jgi:hypothetical protein
LKHFVALFLLSFLVNCVPVQQQRIDSITNELQHYITLDIQESEEEFLKVLNPEIKDTEATKMDDNFQSGYTLKNYGEMWAGIGGKRKVYNQDALKILGNYLVFRIQTGGAGNSQLIKYSIIWNGEYYHTEDGLTVDLVFSFKNLDTRRALVHKDFKIDLSSIVQSNSDTININFVGYDRLINFQYNGYKNH